MDWPQDDGQSVAGAQPLDGRRTGRHEQRHIDLSRDPRRFRCFKRRPGQYREGRPHHVVQHSSVRQPWLVEDRCYRRGPAGMHTRTESRLRKVELLRRPGPKPAVACRHRIGLRGLDDAAELHG